MERQIPRDPLGAAAPLHEILLAETAIQIELPPSLHRLAVQRYEAVAEHIERGGSPLKDRVTVFYPQGSMAIKATIRSRRDDGAYDLDIVAELLLLAGTPPQAVLDLLFEAIRGEKGSRYHDNVERQTRCVTVRYNDGMHLDITPTILLDEGDPRRSWLFHAKPRTPTSTHNRFETNSFAFADWFNERAPVDMQFRESYGRRALARDQLLVEAKAESEPVPDHSTEEGGKSALVVALQLLKRNRNHVFKDRGCRMPPSVFLSSCAGKTASPGKTIGAHLEAIAWHVLQKLLSCQNAGKLVHETNPRCGNDCFTDRWPETLSAQKQYIQDLRLFLEQLDELKAPGSLKDKQELLAKMFGEQPTRSAVEKYAAELGNTVRSGKGAVRRSGKVIPATATGSAASQGRATPKHTFYGGWVK
ncbi:nucleotidyltransferase [Spectribacter hydrogenoxidans]|uniref:Nucleotidyltransferase n=1 Tax=Spectribacter hydrogenoxidans TaxID=3075608 RepID=A0ABU3BZV1_9GAMM|nr:nucleotidyltransferase [Salinisphaera sp. W335]MDT0634843.1 nucleotidyltransferase [Salinisphaera sp. W335]